MLPALPRVERVKMYVGMPIAAAVPKQISWRLVRLNAILVLILDRSLGTFTYAIIEKTPFHFEPTCPEVIYYEETHH